MRKGRRQYSSVTKLKKTTYAVESKNMAVASAAKSKTSGYSAVVLDCRAVREVFTNLEGASWAEDRELLFGNAEVSALMVVNSRDKSLLQSSEYLIQKG